METRKLVDSYRELISDSVLANRCAGCALENLEERRYLFFKDGDRIRFAVDIDYVEDYDGLSGGRIYAFCPACAASHLKSEWTRTIRNSNPDFAVVKEVSEDFVTVAMIMQS